MAARLAVKHRLAQITAIWFPVVRRVRPAESSKVAGRGQRTRLHPFHIKSGSSCGLGQLFRPRAHRLADDQHCRALQRLRCEVFDHRRPPSSRRCGVCPRGVLHGKHRRICRQSALQQTRLQRRHARRPCRRPASALSAPVPCQGISAPSAPWAVMKATPCAWSRCVNEFSPLPRRRGQPVTPGTISNPNARGLQHRNFSLARPNSETSPPFSRTT